MTPIPAIRSGIQVNVLYTIKNVRYASPPRQPWFCIPYNSKIFETLVFYQGINITYAKFFSPQGLDVLADFVKIDLNVIIRVIISVMYEL